VTLQYLRKSGRGVFQPRPPLLNPAQARHAAG
jgi:hypothetical protein